MSEDRARETSVDSMPSVASPAPPEVAAHHREGRYDEAIDAIIRALPPPSAPSAEGARASAAAVRLCNELALACMAHGTSVFSFEAAFSYLRAAQKVTTNPTLKAVTLNNLSIYYARTLQPFAALRCLQRVLQQERAASGGEQRSNADDVSVHVSLNLTTVLADLGRHEEALDMAQQAVRALARHEKHGRPDPSLVSAAYHNLAVQQERLRVGKGGSAYVRNYRNAIAEAKRGGAASTAMVEFVERAYSQAQERAQTRAQSAAACSPYRAPHRSSPAQERGPHAGVALTAASEPPEARPQARPASGAGRTARAYTRAYTVEQLYAGQTSPGAHASAAALHASRAGGHAGGLARPRGRAPTRGGGAARPATAPRAAQTVPPPQPQPQTPAPRHASRQPQPKPRAAGGVARSAARGAAARGLAATGGGAARVSIGFVDVGTTVRVRVEERGAQL